MDHQDELTGYVEKFLFQNNETGFAIFVLQMSAQSTIVTGTLPGIQAGEQLTVHGAWTVHPKFGRQFNAQKCSKRLPTSVVGLKKYLGSGLIKGIGPTYAEKLVDYFGATVLEVIDKKPARLKEVPGIGAKRVEQITTAWQEQRQISGIMVFLQEREISPALAAKIYKQYGHEAIAIIQENPYRLAEDVWGVGFKTADTLALKMDFAVNSIKRIKAGILFAIKKASEQGHLYMPLPELKTATCQLLELPAEVAEPIIKLALHDLYNTQKIKLLTHNDQHYVTLSHFYHTEYNLAQALKQLIQVPSLRTCDLNDIYTRLRNAHDRIQLNDDQQQGIIACLSNKVTIITGGPGTGKTTLIKKLLEIVEQEKIAYKLAAPTGRAAKRMFEGTGRQALTIHRLLEFDVSTMHFSHNEQNALNVELLIIDEASMIDVFLAHALIKALPHTARLVLLGDVDQLPAVGAGNVLNDLIQSNVTANVRLTHIFRQAQDSMIIINAHKINQGEFPSSSHEGARKDFIFIKEQDPAALPQHFSDIFSNTLKRHNIPIDDTVVLVPMNRGVAGTHKLNHDLQTLLNGAEQPKVQRNGFVFKEQDRVMQIKNNYDKLVFNGDIGTITKLDSEEQEITVTYGERAVMYEFSELDELVLAYAISIHKSQGSEYAAVIVPIFMQHFMLLQRNLIYTAITRAKKLCIFIGESKAIAVAIKNTRYTQRITFLQHYLTSSLTCR